MDSNLKDNDAITTSYENAIPLDREKLILGPYLRFNLFLDGFL
jgi:hypothetical protein